MSKQKKPVKQSKPWFKKWWGILLIIFVIIPAVIAAITPSRQKTDDNVQQSQQPSIHYINPTKDITNTKTVGTKYIIVTGYLLNDTKEAGVADCNVEFYDHELKWAGGKGLGGRTLEPGERYNFTVQVEVEHTGLVAKQGINCEQ